jgi:hypothetical protein
VTALTASELHAKYDTGEMTPAQAYEIALGYFEELGELPQAVWYQLGQAQANSAAADEVHEHLLVMRKEFWAALGKPMPEYEAGWL